MPPTGWIDDLTISDNETLWRRIPSCHYKINESDTFEITTSATFRSAKPPLSVNIASLTTKEKTLEGHSGFIIAQFTAGQARSIGCIVVRDEQNDNPAHALVVGNHSGGNGQLTKAESQQLRKIAVLI